MTKRPAKPLTVWVVLWEHTEGHVWRSSLHCACKTKYDAADVRRALIAGNGYHPRDVRVAKFQEVK